MTAITIRDVPESEVLRLRRKAAAAGKSLQAFMRDVISREARTESNAELMARLGREATASLEISDVLEAIDGAREKRW